MARQAQLGWKQLTYGHITSTWQTLPHINAPHINSTTIFSKLTLMLIWKICNIHLHDPPTNPHTNQTQFNAVVKNIFHTVSFDPTMHTLLSYTMIGQIMQKSTRELRRWIKTSLTHLQVPRDRAKQQAALNTSDIQSYFQAA